MLKQAQGCQSRSALVIGSVVHHQNHSTSWILLDQQALQETNEMSAVFGFRRRPTDCIFAPVVTSKDVSLLLDPRSGSRDALLLPNLHPTSSQRWIQRSGRFVHKDELEIVSEDLFFNPSSTSAASALASLSCKWPKSCFGRRCRRTSTLNEMLGFSLNEQ